MYENETQESPSLLNIEMDTTNMPNKMMEQMSEAEAF